MVERKVQAARPFFTKDDISSILSDIEGVLDSGWLILGPYTRKFEEKFAQYCGTEYAVAVNSGTSALELTLRCQGLKQEDEVIVSTNTFVATPNSVVFAGGKPVFADANPETLSVDPEDLRLRITKKTRGVILVHIGGFISPQTEEIKEICDKNDLFLIEDAAHAHGSMINGQKAGSLGDVGCFSFYPTKVITSGEGGAITTGDPELVEKAKALRDQGKSAFHSDEIVELGYSWRMSEPHAILAIHQLKRIEEFIAVRDEIAKKYDVLLDKLDWITPMKRFPGVRNNYYKYVAFLDDYRVRSELKRRLREEYGIRMGGEVYSIPCHLQSIYRTMYGYKEGMFPKSEEVCRKMVCLPMHALLSEEDVEYVIEGLDKVFSSLR